jgi:uncharacterized protein
MTACRIYRSERKAETYLYVLDTLDLDELPAELRSQFGQATLVMRLEIGPETKLSRVDNADVIRGLERAGYFLQLPPRIPVEQEIARRIG